MKKLIIVVFLGLFLAPLAKADDYKPTVFGFANGQFVNSKGEIQYLCFAMGDCWYPSGKFAFNREPLTKPVPQVASANTTEFDQVIVKQKEKEAADLKLKQLQAGCIEVDQEYQRQIDVINNEYADKINNLNPLLVGSLAIPQITANLLVERNNKTGNMRIEKENNRKTCTEQYGFIAW